MAASGLAFLLVTSVALVSCVKGQDKFYIFDIDGAKSSSVIQAFSQFDVKYIFQVTLTERYIVVMPQISQSELKAVCFSKAEVTSYVAERSDDMYASFGANKNNTDLRDLTGNDLVMVEVEFTMQDLSLDEYNALLKKMGNHLQTIKRDHAVHGYHLLGHMPIKIISFDYNAGSVPKGMMLLTGSPHYFRVKTSPVLRIL